MCTFQILGVILRACHPSREVCYSVSGCIALIQSTYLRLSSDAFHIVSTTDPLADSDEENDEHVRLDYGKPPHGLFYLDAPFKYVDRPATTGAESLTWQAAYSANYSSSFA